MHMLRRRMGDERFLAMLREVRRRYEFKELTTEEFRAVAAQFLPPKTDDPKLELFFDQWVYGTGIPALKLSYALKGQAPALRVTGDVTQTEVDDKFATPVPVEIQLARGRVVTHWVTTGDEPAAFSVPVPQAPVKVAIGGAVLRR
jgi:aminopeptidase N